MIQNAGSFRIQATALALLFIILLGCISLPGAQPVGNGTAAGDSSSQQPASGSGEPDAGNGMQDAEGGMQEAGDGAGQTETQNPEPETAEAGTAADNSTVLMLGRSVSYGWAEYMGLEWQEDESYLGEYDGKTIRYREVSTPPDIVDSAAGMMDEYDSEIVFFKLCFVDFGTESGDMLEDDKGYIEDIYYEAVTKRQRKLIVGNALPQVSMSTTAGLKSNHHAFNSWLENFSATHDDIQVLDLYGMLSDSSGNLKSGYAISSDDSHLNSNAYARITPAFMEAIENAG